MSVVCGISIIANIVLFILVSYLKAKNINLRIKVSDLKFWKSIYYGEKKRIFRETQNWYRDHTTDFLNEFHKNAEKNKWIIEKYNLSKDYTDRICKIELIYREPKEQQNKK